MGQTSLCKNLKIDKNFNYMYTHIHVHVHRPNTHCYNLVASSLFSTNLNVSAVSPSSCWFLVFFLFLRL